MQPSMLASTSTTLPVIPAPRIHVSVSLRRSRDGSTRRTPRIARQYIGSPDWLDWERPRSPIRSASGSTTLPYHSPPSSAHSSSTARTRSFLSLLCAATLPKNMIHTRPIYRRSCQQTQRQPTLVCVSKLMNCSPSPGKIPLLREMTMV